MSQIVNDNTGIYFLLRYTTFDVGSLLWVLPHSQIVLYLSNGLGPKKVTNLFIVDLHIAA